MTDYKNIVPNAQNGDPKALDELYKSTSSAVYFTCLSFVKNEQDAEEITQNAYITAFGKLKTLQQPEKFEPWIKRIAVNLCKDFLRKKDAHPTQPLDEQINYETVDENFLPEEYVTSAEKRSIVMRIMRDDLSDVLYQTVIMFYFDEMSVATIAQEMNCPEGTVKYRLNAARAKIRQGVLKYEKKSGDKLYGFAVLFAAVKNAGGGIRGRWESVFPRNPIDVGNSNKPIRWGKTFFFASTKHLFERHPTG